MISKQIIVYVINIKIDLFEFSYHCAILQLVQHRCVCVCRICTWNNITKNTNYMCSKLVIVNI